MGAGNHASLLALVLCGLRGISRCWFLVEVGEQKVLVAAGGSMSRDWIHRKVL